MGNERACHETLSHMVAPAFNTASTCHTDLPIGPLASYSGGLFHAVGVCYICQHLRILRKDVQNRPQINTTFELFISGISVSQVIATRKAEVHLS